METKNNYVSLENKLFVVSIPVGYISQRLIELLSPYAPFIALFARTVCFCPETLIIITQIKSNEHMHEHTDDELAPVPWPRPRPPPRPDFDLPDAGRPPNEAARMRAEMVGKSSRLGIGSWCTNALLMSNRLLSLLQKGIALH